MTDAIRSARKGFRPLTMEELEGPLGDTYQCWTAGAMMVGVPQKENVKSYQ